MTTSTPTQTSSTIVNDRAAADEQLLVDDVQAHYLRPRTSKRRPRRYICYDTEANRETTPTGELQTFERAVASHTRRRSDSGHRPSTLWRTFRDGPDELWKWIAHQSAVGETLHVFAHNAQYDALLSDVVGNLKALGWTMTGLHAPGRLVSMSWAKGGRRIRIVDTYTLFRVPLAKLGELVGLDKLEMPDQDASDAEWSRYNRRDVEILNLAVAGTIDFLDDEDLGSYQDTVASLAWNAYRHRFMNLRPLVHRYKAVLETERDAYYGGRTEVLDHFEHTDGEWTDWDIRMCYSHVAATTDLPYHYQGTLDEPTLDDYNRIRRRFAVVADVDVTTDKPVAPVRQANGVAWAIGRYRSTLWDPELDLILKEGGTLKFHTLHYYRRAPVLEPFSTWCIDRLHGETQETDQLRRHLIKGMSQMIVGKMGQRSRRSEEYDSDALQLWGRWYQLDVETGENHLLEARDGHTFEIIKDGEVDDALPSIAGYVTSAARVMLYELVRAAGAKNVAYMDTDGALTNAEGSRRILAAVETGYGPPLVKKGVYRRIHAFGPQDVELDDTHVLKGVPRTAERTASDSYTVKHFTTWSEAADAGRLDRVTVTERTIHLNRIYKRGWLCTDGRVWPLVIQRRDGHNRVLPWSETPWRGRNLELTDPRQEEELTRAPP